MSINHPVKITAFLLCSLLSASCSTGEKGVRYFFKSKQFHYQAARTLGHSSFNGANPGEVLSVVSKIEDEDEESWHRQWFDMAHRIERLAENGRDHISKGNAYLRASNYYRTSEYFLAPDDERRMDTYNRSVDTFQKGISSLEIKNKIYFVPYKTGKMRNYYFYGEKDKPLVMICGGFDSTNEESFFWMGSALVQRGYPVIMFEGPGQSSMIREYGIQFTHNWHEVVTETINAAIEQDASLKDRKKILLGISLGGLLAGRAAAFEDRIDAVAIFGAPFDMADAALFQMPGIARWLYVNDYDGTFNLLADIKKNIDQGTRWGLRNGIWTVGGKNAYGFLTTSSKYTLKDVDAKVTCPVLVFYGEKDIYVADGIQDELFKKSFGNSVSYTLKIFKEEDGSAEHCQVGSVEQAAQYFVTWVKERVMN